MNVLSQSELADLRAAKARLEYPGLAMRLADAVGRPIETGFRMLPADWEERLTGLVEVVLMRALQLSLRTMGEGPQAAICTDVSFRRRSRDRLHKLVVAGSGVASGAVGPISLLVELPLSTLMILRSIADIARSEGHDLTDPEVKTACLEVLAFGGSTTADDAVDTGYWVVRGALAQAVSEASAHIARKGLSRHSGPALSRLIAVIASRFGSVVTEAAAAKAIPVIGAVSGGTVNYLFMHHFQEMARGHFVIMRLERKYGRAVVEDAYYQLC
jgi:hypothetical protein